MLLPNGKIVTNPTAAERAAAKEFEELRKLQTKPPCEQPHPPSGMKPVENKPPTDLQTGKDPASMGGSGPTPQKAVPAGVCDSPPQIKATDKTPPPKPQPKPTPEPTPSEGATPSGSSPGNGKQLEKLAPKTLTPVERFDQLVAEGKVTGSPENIEHVRKRLASMTNNADRIGAEAELQEMERQIAKGAKPEVQGGQRGTDSPTSEVKARTEPFLSEKNAQNHFNTTIKKASEQFGGQGSTGEAVINLGKETSILGKPITEETARQMVAEALSKGGRGKNITNVLVVDGNGKVIYSGLGR